MRILSQPLYDRYLNPTSAINFRKLAIRPFNPRWIEIGGLIVIRHATPKTADHSFSFIEQTTMIINYHLRSEALIVTVSPVAAIDGSWGVVSKKSIRVLYNSDERFYLLNRGYIRVYAEFILTTSELAPKRTIAVDGYYKERDGGRCSDRADIPRQFIALFKELIDKQRQMSWFI